MQKTVLCMKWGTLYSSDYVNVLFHAVMANSAGGIRFVCLTDDRRGIVPGVECFDIPDIGCRPEMWRRGAWPKLGVFGRDLYGLSGRALFIDLDSVIWGNLDDLFTQPAPFVGIDIGQNWRPRGGGASALLGTGVFAFDFGRQGQIVDRFSAAPDAAVAACRNEQVWVQRHAQGLAFWPRDWVISFKRWLRRPIGADLFLPPLMPPASARIVAFHGKPRPIDLIDGRSRFWDRFPHLGNGQVAWMAQYWLSHGGRL